MVADPAGVGGLLTGQLGGTVGPCTATCLLRAHLGNRSQRMGRGALGGGAGPWDPRFWVAGSENLPYLPRVPVAPEEDRRCHVENGPFSPLLGALGKIPAFQNFS